MHGSRRDLAHRSAHRDVPDTGRGLVVPDTVGVAVSELTEAVGSPTTRSAGAQQRTRVQAAGGDVDGGTAQIDSLQAGERLVVADVLAMAVAELAVPVVAPALHRALAVVEHGTGVVVTRGDP